MSSSVEVRSVRPSANRAVAALQSATGPVLSASPILTASCPVSRSSCSSRPITRFASFEALCSAQQKPDEHAQLRSEIEAKMLQPPPRNDVAVLGEPVTMRILTLLNPLSKDAVEFSATCRAVRNALLHATALDTVVVAPTMVPASSLASEAVQSALQSFFTARGGEVRRLVVRNTDPTTPAASCSSTAVQSPQRPTLPAAWVLQLVSRMSCLTELDLRHVSWVESQQSQVLPQFFSDLHIALPGTLRALKIDTELMQHWSPGWWRRHLNLYAISVGSRFSEGGNSNSSSNHSGAAGIAPAAGAASVMELPADYFALLREEGRRWKLKLWCLLKATSLVSILTPPAGVSYSGVEELLVNLRHNEHVCEWADPAAAAAAGATLSGAASAGASSEPPADAQRSAKARKTMASAEPVDVVIAFPRLHTATVADVAERPEVAAEVYQALLGLAPRLVHFNVCDTVATGAAAAEGNKGERVRRGGGGGGGNHVK